ncbi:MAG TPA: hypothetical protein VHV29_15930 [Terriglobales bacterium]|jgi:hypothetical protein|nr:hypothetical protein [Terriglobales bacterium]
MKITLLVLLILCTAAAFGQAAVLSNQPQITVFPDHPQHAEPHAMAAEHPIAGTTADAYSYAKGERPLWEFGPVSEPTPLGDVARAYRNEKSTTKKAQIVFEKQGS